MTCLQKLILQIYQNYTASSQGKELWWGDLIKNTSSRGLQFDTYEPLSFKFGMFTDMSLLHFDVSLSDCNSWLPRWPSG